MNFDERGNVGDPDHCLKFIFGFDEHDLIVLFLCETNPDTGCRLWKRCRCDGYAC